MKSPASPEGTVRSGVPPASGTAPASSALSTRLAHPDDINRPGVTDALSTGRFATYLRHAGGGELRAWAAYAWNVRVSAELLQVLSHAEVALRNAVDRALASAFGPQWPYASAFLYTFSKAGQHEYLAVRIALEQRLRKSPMNTGDFVAGQTFVFWESLLVKRYKDRVWKPQFGGAFPGATSGESYKDVHTAVEQLRRLRNRIAHHEPLLTEDLVTVYGTALQVIKWTSPQMAGWVQAEWPMSDQLMGPP